MDMLYALIAVIILIADQWLKYWVTVNIVLGTGEKALIPGVVELVNVHNTGAAFSLFDSVDAMRWVFVGLAVLIVALLIVLMVKGVLHSRFARWCAVLAIAGALGNCIDRALYGYVVDMFQLQFVNFAVFNVADIILVVACLMFIVYILVGSSDKEDDSDAPLDEDEVDELVTARSIDSGADTDYAALFEDRPAVQPEPEVTEPEPEQEESAPEAEQPQAQPEPESEEDFSLDDILDEFR